MREIYKKLIFNVSRRENASKKIHDTETTYKILLGKFAWLKANIEETKTQKMEIDNFVEKQKDLMPMFENHQTIISNLLAFINNEAEANKNAKSLDNENIRLPKLLENLSKAKERHQNAFDENQKKQDAINEKQKKEAEAKLKAEMAAREAAKLEKERKKAEAEAEAKAESEKAAVHIMQFNEEPVPVTAEQENTPLQEEKYETCPKVCKRASEESRCRKPSKHLTWLVTALMR